LAAGVASTSPKYELGKVAFSSMFLKRKKSLLQLSTESHENATFLNAFGRHFPWSKNRDTLAAQEFTLRIFHFENFQQAHCSQRNMLY